MEMKFHIRSGAFLLVLWYLVAIIGINIHTCTSSGATYVSPLLLGVSCGEVHPEASCNKVCDLSDGTDGCLEESIRPSGSGHGCCTNDIHFLTVSGQDDGLMTENYLHSILHLISCTALPVFHSISDDVCTCGNPDFQVRPAPRVLHGCGVHDLHSVWRI